MQAASDWAHTALGASRPAARDERAGPRGARPRAVEIAVAVVASVLMATMVAIGGNAVEATTATALPTGGTASQSDFYADLSPDGKEVFRTRSRPVIDPEYTPEGEKIPRPGTPTPDPMVWCRPLNGSTTCIREKS